MQQSKADLAKRYREALKRCLDAFSRLDEKEWNKKASEHWTAKEHLAHIVSNTEDELLVITRQAIAGQPASVPGIREARRRRSSSSTPASPGSATFRCRSLLQRLGAAFEQHISMLEELDEGMLDKPASSPAWGREGTIRDLFTAGYLFLREPVPGDPPRQQEEASALAGQWPARARELPPRPAVQLHGADPPRRSRRGYAGDLPRSLSKAPAAASGVSRWRTGAPIAKTAWYGTRRRDQDQARALDGPRLRRPQPADGDYDAQSQARRQRWAGDEAGLVLRLNRRLSLMTVAAILLAGGESSRMGQPKALLEWGAGQTLIEYQIGRTEAAACRARHRRARPPRRADPPVCREASSARSSSTNCTSAAAPLPFAWVPARWLKTPARSSSSMSTSRAREPSSTG